MKSQTLENADVPRAGAPVRLLIAEDAAPDLALVLLELKRSRVHFTHRAVETRRQFEEALGSGTYDAVVSDYRLPGWTGMDALTYVRGMDAEMPFLLVTGNLGEEAAVDCIKRGVSDYILKDNLARLPSALGRALDETRLRRENFLTREALRRAEIHNRDLVEHSVYGILRAQADGTLIDSNPALLRILGLHSTADKERVTSLQDVFRFPEQFTQLMSSCRESGQVQGAEAEWRRLDGGTVAVRLHLRLLSGPDAMGSVEIIAEDVTELRAVERQLRQAQKFEAIGQLAGGIAHDFNNVIGAILGWAELGIDQHGANPQVAERFMRIREQADRAATLTRELLAFARRQNLQPRSVDLNAVTTGITGFLEKVIGKNIEIKLVTAALAPIKADPTQVEHVLMNLCLHARDAMPNGGCLRIETEMAELDDSFCRFYPSVIPGNYAVLSVADTGAGMDSETREHIFEPFYVSSENGPPRGMALATVYGIVKQHGGFIHVYSEPGQGSLFRVYFPLLQQTAAAVVPPQSNAPPLSELRGTETILLAEDHESIREMSRHALIGLGYRVLAACDGQEALELCKNETPHLAVLDLVMPTMGGPATATKLLRRFAHLPIVFTSGYSQETTGIAGMESAEHYLQKPYSPTTLARLVREVLNHARQATTA
jgi:two-component system, cell cycle sensor histidine kinase and response regulator CckA